VKIFLDSSSFAKRYIDEAGSEKVDKLCFQATEMGLSVICVPEVISAFNRRLREKILTKAQYEMLKTRLLEDFRDATVINLTTPVIGSSISILQTSPVRAMDALHIACSLEWGADLFVSADKRQLSAARKAGLKTFQT